MNLVELQKRKSELLSELVTEAACDFKTRLAEEQTEHLISCEACKRKLEIGQEYENIQLQIKQALGKSNRVETPEKTKAIMRKGQDMTKSEIKYLLFETEITAKKIASRMGISADTLRRTLRAWKLIPPARVRLYKQRQHDWR